MLANVQISKRGVPQKDLNPQTEGRLIASTNLKTSLILQFPIEKKFIRIGAPKNKRSLHCLQFQIFVFIRETVDRTNVFLTILGCTDTGLKVLFPNRVERRKSALLFPHERKTLSAFPGISKSLLKISIPVGCAFREIKEYTDAQGRAAPEVHMHR